MPNDLPPPEGYDSWLDWCVDKVQYQSKYHNAYDSACKEIAILQAKAEAWDAFKSGESLNGVVEKNLSARLAAIEKEYSN